MYMGEKRDYITKTLQALAVYKLKTTVPKLRISSSGLSVNALKVSLVFSKVSRFVTVSIEVWHINMVNMNDGGYH